MITAKIMMFSLFNPLIGATLTDTLENLRTYMDKMGDSLSIAHNDPSIGMFLGTCTAALFFEEQRLQEDPEPPPTQPEALTSEELAA